MKNRPACHQHNDEFGSYLLQSESQKYIKKTTRDLVWIPVVPLGLIIEVVNILNYMILSEISH